MWVKTSKRKVWLEGKRGLYRVHTERPLRSLAYRTSVGYVSSKEEGWEAICIPTGRVLPGFATRDKAIEALFVEQPF